MEHPDALERLADAAADPERWAALNPFRAGAAGADMTPADPVDPTRSLETHVADCAACQREVAAWHRTIEALRTTLAHPDPFPGIAPSDPDALRAATLARVRRTGMRRPSVTRPEAVSYAARRSPTRHPGRGLTRLRVSIGGVIRVAGIAATVVVLLLGTVSARGLVTQRDQAIATARVSGELVATVEQVLRDPAVRVASLHSPGGAGSGSLLWGPSSGELVVMSSTLTPPSGGQVYRCWFEQGGQRVIVGRMLFDRGIAYWSGPLDTWTLGDLAGMPFGISLGPGTGPGVGAPVLVGHL